MQFRTQVDIAHAKEEISYQDRILFLGSCFSDHISEKMASYGFAVTSNPFGTLYNPLSIAACLSILLSDDAVTEAEDWAKHTVSHDGLWHSFLHHGRFSHADKETFIEQIATSIHAGRAALRDATTLIITFGTAWVYEHNGQIVSNCHKIPEAAFTRRRLLIDEIVAVWQPLLDRLAAQGKRVIFTVSPIRHKRDGFPANQLSKATLLLAIEQLGTYFPAYEIVLDELRDYRFFAEDMVHPSSVAVDYVWERFAETYFSATTRETMHIRHKEWKHKQHRALR